MTIELDQDLFAYLLSILSEEHETLKSKLKLIRKENSFVFIDIDEATAVDIRDWAMDKQMQSGFDINYELNPEGKMLEKLIDLFYTG